jgi:hypothetical protein
MKASQEACTVTFYIKDNFQQTLWSNQNLDTLAGEWQTFSLFWNKNAFIEAIRNLKEEVNAALGESLTTGKYKRENS